MNEDSVFFIDLVYHMCKFMRFPRKAELQMGFKDV